MPLEIAEAADEVATVGADIGTRGNPNLTGDAATAVHLAAARSAACLVKITAGLGDLGPEPVERADDLLTAAEAAAARLPVVATRATQARN